MNKLKQKTADCHWYTSAVGFMPHLKQFYTFQVLLYPEICIKIALYSHFNCLIILNNGRKPVLLDKAIGGCSGLPF